MSEVKPIILKNGLKLVLLPDNKKNRTIATIFVDAGGYDVHFKYGNKEYNQVFGIAHFLEHYLLEKSIYGNAMQLFDNDYISANGATTANNTRFFISTVHDFEDNLIKLINIVNNPLFDEDKINDVKKPIISEINRFEDNPDLKYTEYLYKSTFHTIEYNKTLGSKKDINNMTINDIKLFHQAFYQPSNQMIVISGNFNQKKIIKLIEDEYNKINMPTKKIVKLREKEPITVKRKKGTFKDNKHDEISITVKIDISNLTPLEKVKLDFYSYYVIDHNFSEQSKIFKDIMDNKISVYSIGRDYSNDLDSNIALLSLSLETSKQDEAIKLILNRLNNLEYDKESFDTLVNRTMINTINKLEDINKIARDLTYYILHYDCCIYDDIDLIKSFNLDECINMINKLDLSNISIVKRIKGE